MYIEVKIPFGENNQLASGYNRALAEGTSEWVLFLDHDVFLSCNPRWYEMCVTAIESLKEDTKAACIGCTAGGETHKKGRDASPFNSDSIEFHIKQAREEYRKHGNTLIRKHKHITGFFLLVNRKIATEIGFRQQVPGVIKNIDIDFGTRVLSAGYHNYSMPGLYVYHRRQTWKLRKSFTTKYD